MILWELNNMSKDLSQKITGHQLDINAEKQWRLITKDALVYFQSLAKAKLPTLLWEILPFSF